MLAISEKYVGSLCELKDIKNNFLSTGVITNINDEYVEVTYRDDIRMLLDPNVLVKISILNEKIGFKVIVGKVYVGTSEFVRIVEVVTLMDFEKRDFFRIPIDVNTALFDREVTMAEANFLIDSAYNVKIENISLCGVFFTTQDRFHMGEKLYMILDLQNGPNIFACTINRITNQAEKVTGYGCKFFNQDAKLDDQLYKFIHAKQLEYLKKHQSEQL